nr:hypothetical protein [Tanacetum cinerariifolium]
MQVLLQKRLLRRVNQGLLWNPGMVSCKRMSRSQLSKNLTKGNRQLRRAITPADVKAEPDMFLRKQCQKKTKRTWMLPWWKR